MSWRIAVYGCTQPLSCIRLFATPQTPAHQAPLSIEFFRQEYRSGLPFPPTEDLPHPGIEPTSHVSPASQADSLPLSHRGSPGAKLGLKKCY